MLKIVGNINLTAFVLAVNEFTVFIGLSLNLSDPHAMANGPVLAPPYRPSVAWIITGPPAPTHSVGSQYCFAL